MITVHGRVIGCRHVERENFVERRVTFQSLEGETFDLPATDEAYEIVRRAVKNRTPLVLTLATEED